VTTLAAATSQKFNDNSAVANAVTVLPCVKTAGPALAKPNPYTKQSNDDTTR